MLERAGVSIAESKSFDEVKKRASVVTDSHHDEGLAEAMERLILAR
jgi:hydroxymethylpyrimidine pyrophosphatase-like HAD family hydrolase